MKEEKDGDFVLRFESFPSRTSSMSCSSRLYYRTTEGVPFQWEMQPGTPKDPSLIEAVPPPISPPPAVLSLGLPKPTKGQNKLSLFVFGSWKRMSKSKKHSCNSDEFDDNSRFGSCGSHCELMESPCQPKSSSSSLSLPTSLLPAESSRRRRLGCGPWRINPIKIAIGRRV